MKTALRLLRWLREPVFAAPAAPEPAAEPTGGEPPPPPPPPPAAPAPAPPTTPPAGDVTPGLPKLNDVIKTVVTAVATAIGLVGLLTVVGGAITWLRLSQIGLPTQTALSLTPKDDLVALGATGLVIYAGLAVLLVAALYAVDPKGVVTGATLAGVVLLAVGVAVYIVFFSEFDGVWSRVLLIAAAVALAAACLQIGRATDRRFVPFGVAVFFAVLLFGAAATYRGESDHPKVQPAAVLRGVEPKGLVGFFVAATDDRIYLARLTREGRPGALYDLKRDDATRLAVGRRMKCESGTGPEVMCPAARKAAIALRKQLFSDRRKTTKAPAKKKKKAKKKPNA